MPQLEALQITERRLRRIVEVAAQRQRGMMVIMEDVHNPHNLAAIARSCDAFGVQNLAFTLENHELFDPSQVGKVTATGASKWLDYRIFTDGTRPALTTLKSEGWHIMATWVNPEAQSIHALDFTQYENLALMVGNEHAGLSPAAIDLADSYVYLPMLGFAQSFNVSVATALTLFEITRQRLASEKNFRLSREEARWLAADFLQR